MKKVITAMMFGLLFLSSPVLATVNVFACEPEWKALIEAIGGKHVKAYSATHAFQDPHHIEARPSLIAKIHQADLVICTGAELEVGWLPLLLRQSGNAAIQENERGFFLAAAQVKLIEIPTTLDRSRGDVHAAGNPHVHWDPYRLMIIAKALSERLQKIDPAHALDYQAELKTFLETWQQAIQRWEKQTHALHHKKVIVYHKNWSYLLNWLQIEMIGNLEPIPGIAPTSTHLASLLKLIQTNKPDYILITNYQDDKGAQWLKEKTGVPVIRLPFTVGGNEKAVNLETLYNDVLKTLSQAP